MSDKYFKQAYSTHMAGDILAAQARYEQILKKNPKHVETRYMLGALLSGTGDLENALVHLKAAANRMPNSPTIQTGLGNVYLKLGKLDHARDCYQRSLALNPQIPETFFNLSVILFQQRQRQKAATYLEKSIRLRSDFPAAFQKLGIIHKESKHFDGSATCFITALERSPDFLNMLHDIGNIYAAHQDYKNAAICYKRIIEIDPGDDSARHAFSALTGETTAVAPPTHVAGLFDGMADNFESHLKQLGYRAPDQCREMLIALVGDQAHFDYAIDLGCGTGLLGMQFRPMATHLTGLDLSKKMIDLARTKGIYDELATCDICQYLEASERRYDLFLSTDVFAYIGDLSGVFEAINAHANSGAYFIFSTEEVAEQDYILRPTGRYAQSRNYIEALAVAHDFSIEGCRATKLRMEGQQQIEGNLFVLKKH